VEQNRLRQGFEPPDLVVDADLLAAIFVSGVATAFGSSMVLGAFSTSACAALGPPPLEPLDPIIAAFGSGGGEAAFPASTYAALDLPLPEPPDSIIVMVFLAATLGSYWGAPVTSHP
jgi:hypothetical protein